MSINGIMTKLKNFDSTHRLGSTIYETNRGSLFVCLFLVFSVYLISDSLCHILINLFI